MPYMPISWGGARGVNVGIYYMAYTECLDLFQQQGVPLQSTARGSFIQETSTDRRGKPGEGRKAQSTAAQKVLRFLEKQRHSLPTHVNCFKAINCEHFPVSMIHVGYVILVKSDGPIKSLVGRGYL